MSANGYDAEYFEKIYGKDKLKPFTTHWWPVHFYSVIAERLLKKIGGRRVLEIGCGHGYILANLSKRFEAHGADISEYAVRQCACYAPKAKVHLLDVEKGLTDELAKGDFDLVIAKYVFEHLSDPLGTFRQANSALRKGGLIFYSVPNLDGPGARLRGAEWYANTDPTHVSLLRPAKWIELTEMAGFRVVETFSDGFWDLPYYKKIPRILQLPLLAPTAVACITGWRYIPASWGENIMVIAEKK